MKTSFTLLALCAFMMMTASHAEAQSGASSSGIDPTPILERNPNLTATQVREILARSAKKIGDYDYDTVKEFGTWNEHYGYGLIDAYNAVISTPRH